jgi:cell division protein FtsW (lipid II flippase)
LDNRQAKKHSHHQAAFQFQKNQIRWFLIGLVVMALGYLALAQGPWNGFTSLTLAPLLLVAAYVVLIPLAILKRKNE